MELSGQCQCGKVKGQVTVERNKNGRFVCMCDDCQTYARFLGTPGILDANGGTEIVPVVPASIRITAGQDNIKGVRLSPQGLYRWYAGCCNTPLANNPPNIKMPYNGVVHNFLGSKIVIEKALGPIKARIQAKFGKPPFPHGSHDRAPIKLMLEIMVFLLSAWVKGQGKPSAFFNNEGKPLIEPQILTKEERERFKPSLS